MKTQEIKFLNSTEKYSVLIGSNTINMLQVKIRSLCPKTKKIAIIIDKNVPTKFKTIFKKKLKRYKVLFINFNANEKSKSLNTVNNILGKLLVENFNRSDLVVSLGGGITGDVTGFIASIFKRGINFINIPTTLLAQVDSAIGGKTGVNTLSGKNLVGSFYQPKLVLIDTSFLKTLPKKEMICGYAEILKHSLIKDKNFFYWNKKNSKFIFSKNSGKLIYAIKKSCQIKLFFVNKDVKEKGLRMILNFGHTFAHAIEAKNNFSKKITHGEAVLAGMIFATRLSVIKGICNENILREIEEIYKKYDLKYSYEKFSNSKELIKLIPFFKNDKKNDDDKINFIFLKSIGKTTKPNTYKISIDRLKNYCKFIAQY